MPELDVLEKISDTNNSISKLRLLLTTRGATIPAMELIVLLAVLALVAIAAQWLGADSRVAERHSGLI